MAHNYYPESLLLFTKDCNKNCSHCGAIKNTGRNIRHEKELDLIDQAYKIGIKDVCLSGGERMLKYPEVLELLEASTSRGMTKSLMTNVSYAVDKQTSNRVAEDLSKKGLDTVVIGYDLPHLKQGIPVSNHANAIRSSLSRGINVMLYVTRLTSEADETEFILEKLARETGGKISDGVLRTREGEVKMRIGRTRRVGNAKRIPKKYFEYPNQSNLNCKSNSFFGQDQEVIGVDGEGIYPCGDFEAYRCDAYNLGDPETTSLKEAIGKTNESIIGSVVFGLKGIMRMKNALAKSGDRDLDKIAKRKYLSACQACNTFLTNPKSKKFLLSEFERLRGVKPVIDFDEDDMAREESAKVVMDGKEVRFLDYVGPVSNRDFHDRLFETQLKRYETMERDLKIDLSDSKNAIKMVMRNRKGS